MVATLELVVCVVKSVPPITNQDSTPFTLPEPFLDFRYRGVRAVDGRAIRQAHRHEEGGLIFIRQESRGQYLEQPRAGNPEERQRNQSESRIAGSITQRPPSIDWWPTRMRD